MNEKCIFRVTELNFLGHIISVEGIKPDPERIKAIEEMKVPNNKAELQRFLGMVELSRYIHKTFVIYFGSASRIITKRCGVCYAKATNTSSGKP